MDLLNTIRSFIKVVEAGSIAGGARSLGISPAAVSQNIAALKAICKCACSAAPLAAWR